MNHFYSAVSPQPLSQLFKKNSLKWICLFLLLAFCAPPGLASVQGSSQCSQDLIVQPGDSLSEIARRVYGDTSAFQPILAATNARADFDSSYATIRDPNRLEVGWKLCIPERPAAMATPERTNSQSAPSGGDIGLEIYGEFNPQQIRQLDIQAMRQRVYPGSAVTMEETLAPGTNYHRYVVSYRSEGLKIYALMTIPQGSRPASGWPTILFNHGYISPQHYSAVEYFQTYLEMLASRGYILFISDYRGHGDSEGRATGYIGPDYTVDVLHAVAALKEHPEVDADRIGMFGHSLGGNITLRSMVVSEDIKAGVIWAGLALSHAELLALLELSPAPLPTSVVRFRENLFDFFGTPQQNPGFWHAISPNSHLADLAGPIQLHHGEADEVVPLLFSMTLERQLQAAGAEAQLFTYERDDHNLSRNFDVAMARTVQFFDRHLKQASLSAHETED
jgi:uncharacterized protein